MAMLPSRSDAAYTRPYGPGALWNLPASAFSPHPNSTALAGKVWRSRPDQPGNIDLTFRDWTYPVYYAAQATGLYTVRCRFPTWGNLHGKTIPWNPAWKPSQGWWRGSDDIDSQVIVLDPASGREWNLWQVSAPDTTKRIVRCGSASLVPGSYWTKTDGFKPPRGCGIQTFAMLVTADEVADGAIRHALSMPLRGIHKSQFVAPATKTDGPTAQYALADGVPTGTRFALRVTDAELAAWAASLPISEAGRKSALIIGRALVQYGMIVTDNSGATHLQFEDRNSAGAKWTSLGLGNVSAGGKVFPRDLLDGLLTEQRIYALAAPA
jgi:hypothetical protein